MLLVTFGLLGMTSSFGQDVTLKKLYDGIEDMRLEVSNTDPNFHYYERYRRESRELGQILWQRRIKDIFCGYTDSPVDVKSVVVKAVATGAFTKHNVQQKILLFGTCSLHRGLAILESSKLIGLYEYPDSPDVFNAFSVKDINENGLSELMLEVPSKAKGIWGEMHALHLLELGNSKSSDLGSFFIGGPATTFREGGEPDTCSDSAPQELQKSFPSNIIYVQKGKVPQFFAESWEVNCDYLEKGVKAKKVSSLTPIKPVSRAVPLTRLF
jgi:hypothetical protein